MASSIRLFVPLLDQHFLCFSLHHPFPQVMSSRLCTLTPPLRFRCSCNTTIEKTDKKRAKESKKKRAKVCLRLLLGHQVEFGEHVAVLGSSNELGMLRRKMPMRWTEAGWVCEVELRGGKAVEFKFVITRNGGKGIVSEEGENRVVHGPESGVYDLECGWNETRKVVDLLKGESEEEAKREGDGDDGVAAEAEAQAEASSFVEQWQGRDVSFMRSNEHRKREIERRWDIEGLDGIALELVEGDRTARNWWGEGIIKFLFVWNDAG